MGVDCCIYLPGNVRVQDVAEILAILDGVPAEKHHFKDSDGYAARADVQVQGIPEFPSCARIEWEGHNGPHHVLFHFESSRYPGFRLLSPRSYDFWIAAGKRLVDFFGGFMDFNDCDDKENDYFVPFKSDEVNCPSDGAAWYTLQDRILALKPLTDEEIRQAGKEAAYGKQEKKMAAK